MNKRRYRLLHQVVPDERGRPKILHVVIERTCGTRVAGPFEDWRMAQRAADQLNAGDEAPADVASDAVSEVDAPQVPAGPRRVSGL